MVNFNNIGHVGGVMQFNHRPVIHMQVVNHRRRGGNQVDIKLALDALADNFQMQKPQKTAAKTKTQRRAGFHFIIETRIIEPQFRHGFAQILELA